MKTKKLKVIVVFVLILLVLALAKKNIQQGYRASKENVESSLDITKGLTLESISRATLYKGFDLLNKIVLKKGSDGNWILESRFSAPGRKDLVEGFLKELSDLKGELRTDSKELLGDFQIDDATGLHIILESGEGKVLKHLVVGLKKPGSNGNFVRVYDSNKVLLVSNELLMRLALFNNESPLLDNNFLDLKVLSFDPKEVNRIEVGGSFTKVPFILVREESKDKNAAPVWKFDHSRQKGDVDTAKVGLFLQNASTLWAQQVLDPTPVSYGFEKPFLNIKLVMSSGQALGLILGVPLAMEKTHYAKTFPKNLVYKVTDITTSNILKDSSYFVRR